MDEGILEWLHLKNVARAGWVRAGVEAPESVAAHSWGMSLLALHLCPQHLDLSKVLSLCLVHDLPEVRVGDLTPHDDCSTKAQDERQAMKDMAPQWLSLFDEYETGSTQKLSSSNNWINSTWAFRQKSTSRSRALIWTSSSPVRNNA